MDLFNKMRILVCCNAMEVRKLLFVTIFAFCIFHLKGQQIELFGGINTTCFYSIDKTTTDKREYYNQRLGPDIGISINELSADRFRVGLKLSNYKGVYDFSGRTAGVSSEYHVDINKYVIALEFFPLNFSLFTNLKINVGGECSFLLGDATTGYAEIFSMGQSTIKYFKNGSWDGNKLISAGITSRLAYEIALSDEWSLVPQFLFYVGLTDEFNHLWKTMRPHVGFGLTKKLPQKIR